MGKTKKKRNKVYRGIDASMNRPKITKISAANRSKLAQWWFEKKSIAIPALKTGGIILIIVIVIIEIVRIASGNSF